MANVAVLALAGILPVLSAQSPAEGRFEVASIRPSAQRGRPSMEFTPGGGVRANNVTLKLLIQIAYDVRADQLSGGPGWTDSEEYNVIAKGGTLSGSAEDMTHQRLQTLLAD